MAASLEPSAIPRLERLVALAAMAAFVLGATVLVGWWAGISIFREPITGAPGMMPNTALMFAACGGALFAGQRAPGSAVARWCALSLALFTLALSSATLIEHVVDADLGIDRLLAADAPRPPSHNSAFAFMLLGLALLVPTTRKGRSATVVETLCLGAAAMGMLALLGYALELVFFDAPWQLPPSFTMAPHSALGLMMLSVGVLLARRDAALTELMVSRGSGGHMARRLLLVALLTIPATTLAAFSLQERGWWQSPGSAAIAAVASALVMLLALRFTGRRLDLAEAERARMAKALETALEERARLHEREVIQRAHLESIVAQMPVGVVVVDAQGELLLQNRASCDLAKTRNPCIHDVRLPTGEPLRIESLPVIRALRTGERVESEELVVETAGGERVPIIASAAPVLAGDEIVGAVTAFRDIRALKELERMREEWASIIAHDMRQPVNAISLNLDLLKRATLSEKELGPIRRIRSSTQRLNRMIEDLLDISRIESRRLTLSPQPLRLGPVLEEALAGLPELAENCHLDVEDAALQIHADRMRVTQIIENLLTNAAKYGDPSVPVHVRARRENDHVVVSVENRGPGIPPDELQSLFERFTRTRSAAASSARGLGLGLYICRGLVEAHGGRIWVESEPNATTAFHFTLPVVHTIESIVRRVEARAEVVRVSGGGDEAAAPAAQPRRPPSSRPPASG